MSDHPCETFPPRQILSLKDLCCSTCDNFLDSSYPNYDDNEMVICKALGCTGRHDHCASHPKAREYLNKEVIEELEKIKDPISISYDSYSDGKDYGYSLGCEKAIKLLKEGAKK